MSFLKKTTLGATAAPATKPLLGAKKLGGGLKTQPKEIDIEAGETSTPKTIPAAGSKPVLGAKKLGGGLSATKPKLGVKKEVTVEVTEEPKKEVVENTTLEFESAETPKVKLGGKKLGAKVEEPKKVEVETIEVKDETNKTTLSIDTEGNVEIQAETVEIKEEPKEEIKEEKTVKKTTTKKKTAKKKTEVNETAVIEEVAVDESKRVSLQEMDAVMRQIVAPTTELWEQEKKDVLDALNNIKVEQDMTMAQVKSCLADLDELNFEILPKLHDSETMYDGTKQNYDTVKAVAIAKGSGGNAEARKAEGILACKNFVTPSGAVVDLHQYMLLIEERYKFYQKIVDGINFKKYSLVNYNNALKVESKNA